MKVASPMSVKEQVERKTIIFQTHIKKKKIDKMLDKGIYSPYGLKSYILPEALVMQQLKVDSKRRSKEENFRSNL